MILQVFLGLAFGLFVPGFLVVLIFFDELGVMEKLGLSFVFSIILDVLIALLLGFSAKVARSTGGINTGNVWLYSLGLTGILFLMFIIKVSLNAKKNQ